MNEKERTKRSKFLSYVLRHAPQSIGITLDSQGWVAVDELLAKSAAHGEPMTLDELAEVVETNAKKRFAFSEDGLRIRASQGHSVEVELGYAPAEPPATLFHGTVAEALEAIRKDGLLKMSRHHVHLSADEATAKNVGGRRGKPVVLVVDAARMRRDGHVFFVSANGVWLTERVPAEYVGFPE